ncbi:ABC-type nitrate/sulfonate/bicarbonate transport system substrate-binding protein [Stackebrandtia albiflava]|uniref:ABC-type nitrate/sulfonate/bicarbonate transport system substrate-binding protein n=1 Tax=Stackebrandtia albiflava TaxID=406432 RepID=A0A562VCE1_9ACTN|nr:ABC transporter substrate-binding protein [Stackebrandtia albiflava]TWJ15530.1 ABC-type nitrate/sulfonate/bicarbonate transport system substrate-binding protein [Stackebrandtia albiflava]
MTTRRKLLATAGLALAVTLPLAACGGGDDAGTDTVQVAVLGPGSLQWLHAIAKDQGFYDDHGVTVEDIQVQNSGSLVQAVASGSADAGIALGDNVIKAVDEGADIKITGALIQKPALRLYGAPGVEDIADLAGAQVTAGATEGGTYELMLYMLQEAGVDTAGLTPVAIANSSDRVVAMQNDQVQGALLIPPFDTLAEESGANLLGWHDDYWLETPAIVNGPWAKENPEAAAGFTRGLADAARFFADPANQAESVRVLQEYADVDETAAQAAYDFISENDIFSPDLSIAEEGLTNIAEIGAAVSGKDISGFDPADYIDDGYLE